MRLITNAFFKASTIKKNKSSIELFDFLAAPGSVSKMISASSFNLPALSAIVKDMEDRFAKSKEFPFSDVENRRAVGWMIRFIMEQYGYKRVTKSERTRIGVKSGAKYFKTAPIYEPQNSLVKPLPSLKEYTKKQLVLFWHEKNGAFLDNKSYEYKRSKQMCNDLVNRIMVAELDNEIFYQCLYGMGLTISEKDYRKIIAGKMVPRVEIYEFISETLREFENNKGYQA